MPQRALCTFALAATLTGASSHVLANAHDDDMAEALRRIEYATKQINRPAWFDGSRITGNPTGASSALTACENAASVYAKIWPTVDGPARATPRGQAADRAYRDAATMCRALRTAVTAYEGDAKSKDQAAKLDQIDQLIKGYKRPAWFDGTKLTGEPVAADAQPCRSLPEQVKRLWPAIEPAARNSERGRAVERASRDLETGCAALLAAVAVREREQQAAAAQNAARDRAADERRRELFAKLAPYHFTLLSIMPRFVTIESTRGYDERQIPEYKKHLAEVQKICAAHPGIENPVRPRLPNALESHPADVCKVAAFGPDEAIRQLQKILLVDAIAGDLERTGRLVKPILEGHEKQVPDLYQMLVFDRPAWRKKTLEMFKKGFADIKEEPAEDVLAAIEPTVAKLEAKIKELAGTETFQTPPYKDAQVEALVKKQAAKEFKGSQVFKVGLDYNDWKAYDEKTHVASDSKYDYYKVSKGKNRYKRGWLLVKLAGQPLCQSREFIAARVLNGPISIESLDGGGYFVKCP